MVKKILVARKRIKFCHDLELVVEVFQNLLKYPLYTYASNETSCEDK
jgi:hypothetical protein